MALPGRLAAALILPGRFPVGWGGLFLVAALASCATTGDLARVESSVADVRRAVDVAVSSFEAGELDALAALQSVQAEADRAERVAARAAADASERGWTAFDRIVGALVALGGMGMTGYATYRATNAVRDRRRKDRNEPVGRVRKVKPAPTVVHKLGVE